MNAAVVMYRNPAEEWLWESGFIPWAAFGLLVLLLVALGVTALRHWFGKK